MNFIRLKKFAIFTCELLTNLEIFWDDWQMLRYFPATNWWISQFYFYDQMTKFIIFFHKTKGIILRYFPVTYWRTGNFFFIQPRNKIRDFFPATIDEFCNFLWPTDELENFFDETKERILQVFPATAGKILCFFWRPTDEFHNFFHETELISWLFPETHWWIYFFMQMIDQLSLLLLSMLTDGLHVIFSMTKWWDSWYFSCGQITKFTIFPHDWL